MLCGEPHPRFDFWGATVAIAVAVAAVVNAALTVEFVHRVRFEGQHILLAEGGQRGPVHCHLHLLLMPPPLRLANFRERHGPPRDPRHRGVHPLANGELRRLVGDLFVIAVGHVELVARQPPRRGHLCLLHDQPGPRQRAGHYHQQTALVGDCELKQRHARQRIVVPLHLKHKWGPRCALPAAAAGGGGLRVIRRRSLPSDPRRARGGRGDGLIRRGTREHAVLAVMTAARANAQHCDAHSQRRLRRWREHLQARLGVGGAIASIQAAATLRGVIAAFAAAARARSCGAHVVPLLVRLLRRLGPLRSMRRAVSRGPAQHRVVRREGKAHIAAASSRRR
mmetsp:Transcript_13040/g.54625  ORF Transcript_13040/g.54625 Transcript_13040/m.54625 type:complete len:338 (-) Transcript_13040:643-1656(-)